MRYDNFEYISTELLVERDIFFRRHSIHGDNLTCFEFARKDIKKVSQFLNQANLSIYFLVDKINKRIYVGQTENLASRMKSHDKSKDFEYIIVFSLPTFDKADLEWIEWYYIDLLLNKKEWNLINAVNKRNEPNLKDYDKRSNQKTIKKIDMLLWLFEINFYKEKKSLKITEQKSIELNSLLESEKLATRTYDLSLHDDWKNESNKAIREPQQIVKNDSFSYEENNLKDVFFLKNAKMIFENNNFYILENSILINPFIKYEYHLNEIKSQYKNTLISIDKLFAKWKKENKIEVLEKNSFRVLNKIVFQKPSLPAALAIGRISANGWTEWKNTSGKTLDDVLRKNL